MSAAASRRDARERVLEPLTCSHACDRLGVVGARDERLPRHERNPPASAREASAACRCLTRRHAPCAFKLPWVVLSRVARADLFGGGGVVCPPLEGLAGGRGGAGEHRTPGGTRTPPHASAPTDNTNRHHTRTTLSRRHHTTRERTEMHEPAWRVMHRRQGPAEPRRETLAVQPGHTTRARRHRQMVYNTVWHHPIPSEHAQRSRPTLMIPSDFGW
jgi:hypothetical protein